jgi:hypothetical protein
MKWVAKLEAAELLRPDLVNGTSAYRHFLFGGGATRDIEYGRFLRNDSCRGEPVDHPRYRVSGRYLWKRLLETRLGARHERRPPDQSGERMSPPRTPPRARSTSLGTPGLIGGMTVMMLLSSCTGSSGGHREAAARDSLTTHTDSQSLSGKDQRLQFLARYLRFKSPVVDTEFTIRYRDNSGGAIPGPSDWDIRAVLQVGPKGTGAWREGWVACDAQGPPDAGQADVDTGWAKPLLGRRVEWRTLRSPPRCYRHPRSPAGFVILYDEDGIVLYRSSSGGPMPS